MVLPHRTLAAAEVAASIGGGQVVLDVQVVKFIDPHASAGGLQLLNQQVRQWSGAEVTAEVKAAAALVEAQLVDAWAKAEGAPCVRPVKAR
jgi:hypothetical protein